MRSACDGHLRADAACAVGCRLTKSGVSSPSYRGRIRAYYQCKRAQGKTHEVALSHLMRILTRRLVAVLRSGKPYQSHYNLKNAA